MNWRPLTIAILVVIWTAPVTAAQIYQWTDENGVKHYSNTAPPDNVAPESMEKEIAGDPDAARRKAEREAAIIQESEANQAQRDADAQAIDSEAYRQKEIAEKEAELESIGESIGNKRKYIRRRGRQDINKYERLGEEIEALKADPSADPEKIESLEAERAAVKKKILNTPRRNRKGVGDDIEQYKQVEKELNELKEAAPAPDAAE